MATKSVSASDDKRAQLGDRLKLLFVTLHAGWQSARREGDRKQYRARKNSIFRKFSGAELRTLRRTDRGLIPG